MPNAENNGSPTVEILLSIPTSMHARMEKVIKHNLYGNRQEFIKQAIREKISRAEEPNLLE